VSDGGSGVKGCRTHWWRWNRETWWGDLQRGKGRIDFILLPLTLVVSATETTMVSMAAITTTTNPGQKNHNGKT